ANKIVGNKVGPVHSRNNVNHQNQFVPQVVLLKTGKVNIPPASPQLVSTGNQRCLHQFLLENPYSEAKDEGIFDSSCSRSMTGNMERLDDFQEFLGGKVTFGGVLVPLACFAQAVPPPIPEPIPEPMPEPDQPQDHLSTPPRQQTSNTIAPVFEHGQSLDPNIASFSQVHETDDDPFTSTNVEDEPLGGSFHASLPRSFIWWIDRIY
ncbi:hypothetical protein Tco_1148018, partial [Tanacetum coccineum]